MLFFGHSVVGKYLNKKDHDHFLWSLVLHGYNSTAVPHIIKKCDVLDTLVSCIPHTVTATTVARFWLGTYVLYPSLSPLFLCLPLFSQ